MRILTENSPRHLVADEQGGALVIGGINAAYQLSTPLYTPIVEQLYYSIGLSSVTVGSNAVTGISAGTKTIVDTGTTLWLLPNSHYSSFKSAYLKGANCNLPGMGCDGVKENSIWDTTICWYLTDQQLSRYPTIVMTFPAVSGQSNPLTLTLTPDSYFLLVQGDRGNCRVLGIDQTDGANPVLGASVLQNFNVIFDRANTRIGFAPVSASCNLSTSQFSVIISHLAFPKFLLPSLPDIAFVPQAPFYRQNPISSGLSSAAVAVIVVVAVFVVLACVGVAVFLILRARRRAVTPGSVYST